MTTLASPEQLILELINRARMDPAAEAGRLGIDLNQWNTSGTTITATSKQVLAGNNALAGIAESHSVAMNTSGVLTTGGDPHNGAGDGTTQSRFNSINYLSGGAWGYGENVAPEFGTDLQAVTETIHRKLFIDDPAWNRGPAVMHRINMLNDNFREVGIGEITGTVKGTAALIVTEDFGYHGTQWFLTGAVYNDTVIRDRFYSVGEGVQGVTATVTGTGGTVGSDTTGSGGGWTVGMPGGTYTVTFSGGGLAAAVSATVEAGNRNAKVDLVNGNEIDGNVNTTLGVGAKDLRLLGMDNVNGTGNASDNAIYGNRGNNVLDGSAGTDTAVYSGNRAAYTIATNANGTVTVGGAEGTDTLISIERIQFADQAVVLSGASAGSVSINDVTITEGNNGTQVATFTVARSGGTAAFDVSYATSNGTATVADNDYVAASNILHFAANETAKTISVTINGDTKVEANETFNVLLSGATNGATISDSQGVGTISNDDVAAVAGSVSIGDVTITEGDSGTKVATFAVARSGGTAAFDVSYATSNGTATVADGDYVAASNSLHFAANETAKTISVTINSDTKVEANETFNVVLSNATAGATISDSQGIGTITNDDVNTNHLPIVTTHDASVTVNRSVAASSLFTAHDQEGDNTITQYAFWDGGSGGGHLSVNGVTQASGQWIYVNASDLGSVTYVAGSATGSETLYIDAKDGQGWGDYASLIATTMANQAPVVTAPDFAASHNQNVAASALFSVSDANGDSMANYQFWDSTADAASGRFMVNGVAKGTNQVIDVSAAQLSQTTFQSGSGSDDLWVRAFDGTDWSDWKEFHVNAPINAAPVVTAPDFAATRNQNIAASSLFSVSDADRDSMTKYQFWDSTTDAASGHFVVNGVAQGTNQVIDVSAVQLSQATFQSGSGSDDLWVRAFDGTDWSAWKEFHVNPPVNYAPVVAAPDFAASHNQNIAASALFSVSDANGDSMTTYQFWDSTTDAASGHFMVNGVAQGTNQIIDVSAGQLSQATFQSGSGSDDLWVRAFDGTVWSDWKEFHVNAPLNQAPVVTAPDFAASHNQNIAATSLFSVSDANGDSMTNYQFWDSTTDAASGHFMVNGVAQGTNQIIDVSGAQLSQTTFQSGSGSDDLWVRAFDGIEWGNWKEFHVNAPIDAKPVVAGGNASLALNATVAASMLFTVTDADDTQMVKYQFWDSTPGATTANFTLGGVEQAANQAIDVMASQLDQASLVGGSVAGNDSLWVRASDGMVWSDWHAFNATTHS